MCGVQGAVWSLGPEEVVGGVLLCLHAIDPATRARLPGELPTGHHWLQPAAIPVAGMSARFNFGAKLATEVRGLGFSGDLGYQTFLYPSEREVSGGGEVFFLLGAKSAHVSY